MGQATAVAVATIATALAFSAPASAATAPTGTAAVKAAAVAVTAPDPTVTTQEREFTALINASRDHAGRRAYASNPQLVAVARAQALRMAASDKLAHNPHLSTDVHSYRWVGENVGFGYDVAGLHRAFIASAPHRANILDADFTQVGVGIAVRDGRIWVAEVFRQPATVTRSATPRHHRAAARAVNLRGVTWAGVTWAGVTWASVNPAGVTWAGVTWA